MCLGPYFGPENRDTLNLAAHGHENKPRLVLITHAMKPRPASCPENDTDLGGTHESPGERRDSGAGISVPGMCEMGAGICVPGHRKVWCGEEGRRSGEKAACDHRGDRINH